MRTAAQDYKRVGVNKTKYPGVITDQWCQSHLYGKTGAEGHTLSQVGACWGSAIALLMENMTVELVQRFGGSGIGGNIAMAPRTAEDLAGLPAVPPPAETVLATEKPMGLFSIASPCKAAVSPPRYPWKYRFRWK